MLRFSKRKVHLLVPLFIFLFCFSIYLHNLSHGVYGGDVGDFLSAIAVRGVPHPPGYPLFTLFGVLSSHLPFAETLAYKVGIVSALFAALSVVLVYTITFLLTKRVLVSILTSFITAFFYLFWLYAEIAEVFSLLVFFVLLLLFLCLLFYTTRRLRYFYFVCFVAGLSLTNHHMIVLVFPSLAILLFSKSLLRVKILLIGILCAAIGFLPYLYVPLAAMHNPPINWDHATTVPNFLRLFFRVDYGTFSAAVGDISQNASTYQRYLEVKQYFSHLFINLTPIGVVLGVFGLYSLLQRKKRIAFALLLGYMLTGPLFIAYAGFPLLLSFHAGVSERFYLVSSVIFILLIPFGILFIENHIIKFLSGIVGKMQTEQLFRILFVTLFFFLPITLFRFNFPKTDLSKVLIGDLLAKDFLTTLPHSSVLFVGGDTALFNTQYAQYGLGVRLDVQLININGPDGSVFFVQKRDEYLKSLHKKQFTTTDYMGLLRFIAKERAIFSQERINDPVFWMPHGIVYKFVPAKEQILAKEDFLKLTNTIWAQLSIPYHRAIESPAYHNLSLTLIPSYYSIASANVGDYLVSQYDDIEAAVPYYRKAITINPEDTYGFSGMGYVALTKKNCQEAEQMFNRILTINPVNQHALVLLYATYQGCFHDDTKAQIVAYRFRSIFNQPIDQYVKKLLNTEKL